MKIPSSIRELYNQQAPLYARLQDRVREKISAQLDPTWHFECRVKELESYALKLESGRFDSPDKLEDFFACSIVVQNLNEVQKACKIINRLFVAKYRRPQSNVETIKPPDTFRFDDLRLYVEWRDDPALPETGFAGRIFEVQIKTYLQHAWGIATHDLVYKTDSVSWPKERVAYQIKAMLEHAELSIQEALKLSRSSSMPHHSRESAVLSETICCLKELWPRIDLPKDLRRLAQNLVDLFRVLGLKHKDVFSLLKKETAAGRGAKISNLSPYLIVLQTLCAQKTVNFSGLFARDPQKFKILLPQEVELPDVLRKNSNLRKHMIAI